MAPIPRKLLPIIFLIALALRLWGIRFGLPYAYTRLDETAIAGPAVGFLSGNLDPPYFIYPTFFLYAVAATYAGWYVVSRPFTGYASLAAFADSRYQSVAPFFYLSRGLSAVMGALTVWFVFALCRRVFDETVGIIAALFTALAYLLVRDSHFGTTDITMTALVVLTVAAIARWRDVGGTGAAVVAGIAGGLATSTKYNALGVGVPFALAYFLRAARDTRIWRGLTREAVPAFAFVATLAFTFFATSPYTLIEPRRFLQDLLEPGQMLASAFAGVALRGWFQYARVTLPAALGWPLYLAGVAGVVWALAREFKAAAIVFAFPVAYYVVAGSGHTAFARYIIPVLPFLAIGAAWFLVTAVRAILPRRPAALENAIIFATACLFVFPSARNAVALDRILTRPDTRLAAARALARTIPPGSLVYQSGDPYGRVPFDVQGSELTVTTCDYDESTGRFTPDGARPDWIILQRSPLVAYSHVPAGIERIVQSEYEPAGIFSPGETSPRAVYDQQDAFFLPLDGLDRTSSPGPRIEVYRHRAALR
jgi:Dolichyl-phosphate-mannose-protein mannosyltransferase